MLGSGPGFLKPFSDRNKQFTKTDDLNWLDIDTFWNFSFPSINDKLFKGVCIYIHTHVYVYVYGIHMRTHIRVYL